MHTPVKKGGKLSNRLHSDLVGQIQFINKLHNHSRLKIAVFELNFPIDQSIMNKFKAELSSN